MSERARLGDTLAAAPSATTPGRPRAESVAGPRAEPGYGLTRVLPFVAVGLVGLVATLFPFPPPHLAEYGAAAGLGAVLTLTAIAVPWRRLPPPLWPLNAIAFFAVIALLRDSRGGGSAGSDALLFVPIIWLALYASLLQLFAGMVALILTEGLPTLIARGAEYPLTEWDTAVVELAVGVLLSVVVVSLVRVARSREATVTRRANESVALRERLTTVLAAASETAIIGSDHRGIIEFFSPGAARLLGRSASDVIDRCRLTELLDGGLHEGGADEGGADEGGADEGGMDGAGALPAWIEEIVAGDIDGAPAQHELSFVTGAGTRIDTLTTAARWRTEEDSAGLVLVLADITARKQRQAARDSLLELERSAHESVAQQNQRLEEIDQIKDDLVANVSHELRTPLTSILGFLDLLLDDDLDPPSTAQREMLEVARVNSLQLARIVDDLIAEGRLSAGVADLQRQAADVAQLVDQVATSFLPQAVEADVSLSVTGDDEAWAVVDPGRFVQLMSNLVSNALKFTPPGGAVDLFVGSAPDVVVVETRDTGTGIAPGDRAHLFDRFYRGPRTTESPAPGFGIGLPIAKLIAEAHGGSLRLADAAGWSTVFRLEVPRHPARGDRGARGERPLTSSPALPILVRFPPWPKQPAPPAPPVSGSGRSRRRSRTPRSRRPPRSRARARDRTGPPPRCPGLSPMRVVPIT